MGNNHECVIPGLSFNSSVSGTLKDVTGSPYNTLEDDISIGTYITNFFVAFVAIVFAVIILKTSPSTDRNNNVGQPTNVPLSLQVVFKWLMNRVVSYPYHHRRFIGCGMLSLGIASTFSGIQHTPTCQYLDSCRIAMNVVSNFMICVSGAGSVSFTIALFLRHQENHGVDNGNIGITEAANRYAKWTLGYIAIFMIYILLAIVLHATKFLLFSTYFLLGAGLPALIIIIAVGVYQIFEPKLRSGRGCLLYVLACLGLIFVLVGIGFQIRYSKTCGIPCPCECPSWIPVPNFNHNAIFHVIIMVSQILFGCWGLFYSKELEMVYEVFENE